MDYELYHYGVKGQKWGVRRYQNSDGTLTDAGKKRYNRMSDDKLQKTLYKQVKDARAEQNGGASRWNVTNTIGKNSKAEWDKYNADREAHRNSEAYKKALKELDELDERFNKGGMTIRQYHDEFEKIKVNVYRPDLDNSVTYTNNGRKYAQAYLDKYGKDLNIAYLKDLGYDEATAKEFTERIMKANKKMLNGM